MKRTILFVAAGLLVIAALITGASKNPFSPDQKAFYADQKTVNFVRPGLVVKLQSASIAADGVITARVKVTDPLGVPLDRTGTVTPGPVSLTFIAAVMPKDRTTYLSYTTRVQTSPITRVAATQAAGENNGAFTPVADGEYTYRFSTRAPSGFDNTATHTIGVYSNRNLSAFDLGTNYASDVFHFVPAGGTPGQVRDVIKTETCNKCHLEIAAHGGSRRGMPMCVLCHQPQTVDPDTGNTVDMTVMTHRIHMGKDLPSVRGGKPYQIIGNQQSVNDYSAIGFPSTVRNCAACHVSTGPQAATQALNYLRPSIDACGSCHDNLNFTTGVGHPPATDANCAQCHRPEGEREWDISVRGAHTVPEFSRNLKGVSIEILEVTNTRPGQQPRVTYRLRDGAGQPLVPTDMTSLSLVLAGPTSDYRNYWSEAARTDTPNPGGTATHQFARAIPTDSTGSYTIGAEGYRNVSFEGPGRIPTTVRDPLKNVITTFSLTGGTPERRRTVVALEKCNTCHNQLELHGRNRNQIEHCVTCHNPNVTDVARRPQGQGDPESVNFSTMIHRIHTAKEQGRPYIIYGFGNNPINLSDIGYPMTPANCNSCHVNNSQNLPLRPNLQAVTDPRGFLNPIGPAGNACLSCHSSRDAAAHVDLNTSRIGESCTVCHGPNSDFSVARVHAR